MNLLVLELSYGAITAILGAAAAVWYCRRHNHRSAAAQESKEASRAAEILVRLQELTTRIAFDVDEHNIQVEEISDELTASKSHDSTTIVDIVARLIQANQEMHEKLASSEDKLSEQARQIQTYSAEARTDALTLLANRRAFDDELGRRFAEFARLGRNFSLIMADVDYFKTFNDSYGHRVGDGMLQSIAKLLRRKMREMDLVARYGGEEFAIVLPGAGLDEACDTALRVCDAVEKSVLRHDEKELRVTVSFGAAEAYGCRDDITLVNRADEALYAAKNGGRDCVYSHDGAGVRRVLAKRPSSVAELMEQMQDRSSPAEPARGPDGNQGSKGGTAAPMPGIPHGAEQGAFPELPSRTSFCQQIRSRMAEWKRNGPAFSVILLQVSPCGEDHGQRVRDIAAQATARFLMAAIREMDVAGHYAPNRFALLLPATPLADATLVAERLRETFSQCSIPLHGMEFRLAIRVGVAHVTEVDEALSVLTRAEAALDRACRQEVEGACYHDGQRILPISTLLQTTDVQAT
jgi:diguanylate cyclase